ncbi:MAG: glucose 1-dehydrogenase [SAR202 cluster bacterium]|nr:glucose 1-dehydrogenase [SAR202 cluster bacterium]
MKKRLEGKVALISGGATAHKGNVLGIGGAAAWLFAREGAKVVLGDLDDARGEEAAAQLRESGAEAAFAHLNATNEADWEKAVAFTMKTFGRLDVLVNSAGTTSLGGVEETTEQAWDGQLDVHAKAVFLGTKHAIPAMRKSGGGSIINISSIDGITGNPLGVAYSTGKGASRIFTKAAAIQYAKENIRVNSVHPGYTDTPLARHAISGLAAKGIPDPRVPKVPLGRLAKAEEIGYGILFLASDESAYVTGAELVIDGGVTAQ